MGQPLHQALRQTCWQEMCTSRTGGQGSLCVRGRESAVVWIVSLEEEFRQQEALLAELEGHVTQYRQQGKMEASARLEQQTQLLKKHFAEVLVKFRKFQRPPEFEPKMNLVKRELDFIQERIHLLEISSADPADIQERHDTCMTYYKTMSGLKGEVEYVIKTGRQVVEHRQVDFPDKLGQQLDAIKQLYNDLGAQVTQHKTDLDKGLKLSRKLHKEMTQLTDFIADTNTQLTQRHTASRTHNVDEELAQVKVIQEDMKSREPSLQLMSEWIQQLQTLAEEADVSEGRHRLYTLNQDLTQLFLRVADLKEALQEECQGLDGQFIDFQSQMLKVKEWLAQTETKLTAHCSSSSSSGVGRGSGVITPSLQPPYGDGQEAATVVVGVRRHRCKPSFPRLETIKQNLQQEMNDMKSQVDEVRDLAITLMSRSHRFTPMVEPELTHLNQRWEEVATLLKVKQTVQQQPEAPMSCMEVSKVSGAPVRKTPSPSRQSPRLKTKTTTTEGLEEFNTAYQTVQNKVAAFDNDVVTGGEVAREADFTDCIQTSVEYHEFVFCLSEQKMEEESEALQREVTAVLQQGEQLVQAAAKASDSVTQASVSDRLQELKELWQQVCRQRDAKRDTWLHLAPAWSTFRHDDQELTLWFSTAEQQLSDGDIIDVQNYSSTSSELNTTHAKQTSIATENTPFLPFCQTCITSQTP
ncbi:hypothetical protein ACOMHN_021684 [Nucella lapillus]